MKVMFICTGNICRSAMAKGLLEKRIEELGKEDKVYSCGISAEDGDGATYYAMEAMEEYGVEIKNHRATYIKNSVIEEMDLVLCLTNAQKLMVSNMYPELKEKIYGLKEYTKYQDNKEDKDILDPWGHDLSSYRKCAEEIQVCIEILLEKWYQIY